jgi:hypothetical protein
VLTEVVTQGWSHVVFDGKVFRTDRCAETTLSAKGETINAWYSGKHRAPGGNVQAIVRPDGLPVWVSDVLPGHRHDLTCARATGVLAALYWSASQLDLPALADSGYDGAGQGVHTPIKQPGEGQVLARTTRPTTRCCAPCAAAENAASPCSPAAGERCAAPPPAPSRPSTPVHPRDPGRHLAGPGGVNPEPPIPLPDHDVAGGFLPIGTTGGIGARSGVDTVRSR